VSLARRRDYEGVQSPPLLAMLLVLVAGLSALRSGNILGSAREVLQLAEYFIVGYMLFAGQMQDRDDLRQLVHVFAGCATVIVGLGLLQYLTPAIAPLAVRGPFENRNVLGGFLALTLPMLFGLYLYDRGAGRRLWYLPVLVAGVLANLSGASLIAVAVAFGAMAMLRGRGVFLVYAILLVVAVTLVASWLPRKNGGIARDSIALCDEKAELAPRYKYWQAAAAMVMDHPLRGVGIGRYQETIHNYDATLQIPAGHKEEFTENLYLVAASETGLPGLVLLAGLFIAFMAGAARTFFDLPDGPEKGIALGVFGSLLAFAVACLWSPLLMRGIGLPLAFVLSLGAAVERIGREAPARPQRRAPNAESV
jgi:hypothetical protein